MEELKEIPGIPNYLVTESGKVWSEKTSKWLQPYLTDNGYLRITFQVGNKQVRVLQHRLLAFIFLDLEDLFDTSLEVHHLNENTLDNRLVNLKVLTAEEHRSIHSRLVDKFCDKCGKKMNRQSTTSRCIPCTHKKTLSITLEQVLDALATHNSWLAASKSLGISDNGLRKKYKSLSGNDVKCAKEHAKQYKAGKVFTDT